MKAWTVEELEILRSYYKKDKATLVTLLPNRTWSAIKCKAHRLGLKRYTKRKLTNEELAFVRDNYKHLSVDELARKLGRSKRAVYRIASEIHATRRIVPCLRLTDLERGYVAGIIDGEGHLGIEKEKSYLQPFIRIGNTSKELLLYLQNLIGGKIHQLPKRNKNWKDQFRLDIQRPEEIIAILNEILPLFIVKKIHAQLLFKFCESRLIRFQQPNTREEFILYEKMKELNRRGQRNEAEASIYESFSCCALL
jgi:hypothetical protein